VRPPFPFIINDVMDQFPTVYPERLGAQWGHFSTVAKNRSPPTRSRRHSRNLADPLRRHPFRQHRNAITMCRSHVRSVRCANNAIRALDCLLTIKSKALHRPTKTRTTQAHDLRLRSPLMRATMRSAVEGDQLSNAIRLIGKLLFEAAA